MNIRRYNIHVCTIMYFHKMANFNSRFKKFLRTEDIQSACEFSECSLRSTILVILVYSGGKNILCEN
jgi:hypothetical protein